MRRLSRSDRGALLATCALLAVAVAGSGCGGKQKPPMATVLGAEDLYEQALEQLEQRKLQAAIESLEAIDLRYDAEDQPRLEPLIRLAMADATFYKGSILDLIDARSLYLDFVTFKGDHARAPYAQFQAGVCSLEQVNHPSRDQSQTAAAFRDLRQVIRRYPNSRYADAARDMIRQAEDNLAEHEFLIGRFYLKRKRYVAATGRFKELLERFPEYDDKEKVYYHLARSLLLGDNDVEGRIYADKLMTDYPDTRYEKDMAQVMRHVGQELTTSVDGPTN